jgi:hypothetical protein
MNIYEILPWELSHIIIEYCDDDTALYVFIHAECNWHERTLERLKKMYCKYRSRQIDYDLREKISIYSYPYYQLICKTQNSMNYHRYVIMEYGKKFIKPYGKGEYNYENEIERIDKQVNELLVISIKNKNIEKIAKRIKYHLEIMKNTYKYYKEIRKQYTPGLIKRSIEEYNKNMNISITIKRKIFVYEFKVNIKNKTKMRNKIHESIALMIPKKITAVAIKLINEPSMEESHLMQRLLEVCQWVNELLNLRREVPKILILESKLFSLCRISKELKQIVHSIMKVYLYKLVRR